MTGVMMSLLGSGGFSQTFQVPVGYGSWAVKGVYTDIYGYNTANSLNLTNSPAPIPATLFGQTVSLIGSINTQSGPQAAQFGVTGATAAFLPQRMIMNGVTYNFGAGGVSWSNNQTVTITIASPGTVTWTSHGLANDQPVSFTTTGALPTGLTANTIYYARNVTTNTFNLATTPGGASINTSGTQSGTHTGYKNPYYVWSTTTIPASGNATGGRTPFTATISVGTPAVVTATGHGLTNGKRVMFSTTGALPTGLSINTVYFVVNALANTFNVSATSGGAAINTTIAGSGTHTCFEVVDIRIEG